MFQGPFLESYGFLLMAASSKFLHDPAEVSSMSRSICWPKQRNDLGWASLIKVGRVVILRMLRMAIRLIKVKLENS